MDQPSWPLAGLPRWAQGVPPWWKDLAPAASPASYNAALRSANATRKIWKEMRYRPLITTPMVVVAQC